MHSILSLLSSLEAAGAHLPIKALSLFSKKHSLMGWTLPAEGLCLSVVCCLKHCLSWRTCTYFWIILLFYYIKTGSLDIRDLTFIAHPQQVLFLHTRAHWACTCENTITDSTFSATDSDILTNVMANSATVLFYACALHYLTNHNIFSHSFSSIFCVLV